MNNIDYVNDAIENALNGQTKLNPKALLTKGEN